MKNKLVVMISAADWDGVFHRPHHFAKRFAKQENTSVLYLEPPATLISPLKNMEKLNTWARWTKGAKEVEPNLFVLSPPPTFPFGMKRSVINKMNQQVISAEIAKFIDKKKMKDYELILYNFLPSAADLISNFKFSEVIYDCVDDHAEFKGLVNADYMLKLEEKLCKKSDVCFATAQKLLEDRVQWNSNFHLVNNGADFEHFYRPEPKQIDKPTDFPETDKKIIGFVGGIGTWIDLEWIKSLAQATTDTHHLVLIGPTSVDLSSILSLPNLTYLGKRHYDDLPNYYHHFDFAIMPFKIEKLTESVNPIKMYEYFSAGIPTISTGLKEALRYQHVLSIYNSGVMAAEFIKTFQDTPENIALREKEGKENSWDGRFAAMLSHTKSFT